MNAVIWMTIAAAACCALLSIVTSGRSSVAVLLGMIGPLVAAAGSWMIVERVHRRAPEQVSRAMIKLFGAKFLFFGAYVGAAVVLLPGDKTVLLVSFGTHYILLHLMEALFLQRLFAVGQIDGQRLSVS